MMCVLLLGAAAWPAVAQPRGARAHEAAAQSAGPEWSSLDPAQRKALAPLQKDWADIDGPRRQKWVEIAGRFDRMSASERARVQQRMADWVQMTPRQRNEARQNFHSLQELSPSQRQDSWEAYKALPEEQRRGLAARARGSHAPAAGQPRSGAPHPATPASPKVNTVPNPLLEARPPRPITPSVVQARPGATTNSIAAKPNPPLHQHPGLPKVAATPAFVDTTTLLPQRGPQGAATEPRPKTKKKR